MKLFDSHCHVIEARTQLHKLQMVTTQFLSVMSIREADWEPLKQFAFANPERVTPCFGVHPWECHEVRPGWQDRLRHTLECVPCASVGECGLDKLKTQHCSLEDQIHVLRDQLTIASALNRAVSLHCVKAESKLYDVLSSCESLPANIAIHSYGGSVESMKRFIALKTCKVSFGFSQAHCTRSMRKLEANVRQCPLDRLLLESDLAKFSMDKSLANMAGLLGKFKEISAAEVAQLTTENAMKFYSIN